MKCNCCGQSKHAWICHRCLNVSPIFLQKLYLDKLIEQNQCNKLMNNCNIILNLESKGNEEYAPTSNPIFDQDMDTQDMSLSELRETLQLQLEKVSYWKINRQCDKINYYINHLNGRIEQKRQRLKFLESELLRKKNATSSATTTISTAADISISGSKISFDEDDDANNLKSLKSYQESIDSLHKQLLKQQFLKFDQLNNWFNIMTANDFENDHGVNNTMIMFHIPIISLHSKKRNKDTSLTIPIILESLFKCNQYIKLIQTIFDVDNSSNTSNDSDSLNADTSDSVNLLNLSFEFDNKTNTNRNDKTGIDDITDNKKTDEIIKIIETNLSQLILNIVKVCQKLQILPSGPINLEKLIELYDIPILLSHIVKLNKIDYNIDYSDCIWTLNMCKEYIRGKFNYNLQPHRKDRWFVVG